MTQSMHDQVDNKTSVADFVDEFLYEYEAVKLGLK